MQNGNECTIGILADELTSAADGAAPFVARGLRAVIGRGKVPDAVAPICAVDGGMRSATAAEAARMAGKLAGALAGRRILYKTVDSTLRGHVRVELEAAFEASGRDVLVFAPAFPAAGRMTVGGIQHVNGVPVEESAYGRDPVHPARHSRLAELVPSSIAKVILLDAARQEDLDRQIADLPEPQSILWVGSPGMAAALAKRFTPAPIETRTSIAVQGDILVAVGTANPVGHRQAERIAADSTVTLLRAPVRREKDPALILRDIAEDAAGRVLHPRFHAVIATGGDTMEAILDRLGICEFEILRELEPGFPLGRARLENGRDLLIAMKAGGFGDDETLLRAITVFRARALQTDRS